MIPKTRSTITSEPTPEQYKGWIEKYSREAGLDPKAVTALGQHESGWRNVLGKLITNPKSRYYGQRAVGPLQVMPGNALPGENLYDPETNIKAGIRILGQNLKASKGDYSKAFGAYYGTNPPPGDESTESYIGKVMDLYKKGEEISSPSGSEQPALSYNQALYQAMYAGVKAPAPQDIQPYIDYSSIQGMDISRQIDFLKNPNVNPANLKDPFQQLASIMYRWEQVKANVERGKYTPEQQTQIASNFFDQMIAPYQQRTKDGDINKDAWMKFAYKLKYDMDAVMHGQAENPGTMNGWFGLVKDMFRGIEHSLNLFGAAVATTDPRIDPKDYKSEWRNGGFWDRVEHTAQLEFPKLKGFSASLNADADYYELLQSFRPLHGPGAYANSIVVQGAPWLLAALVDAPAAIGAKVLGTAGKIAAEKEAPGLVAKTTELLVGSKRAGRIAEGATHAARDGFLYGVFTRKNEDTAKAFEDAIEWGAGAALLHLAGAGLAGVGGALYKYLKAKGAERELKVAEALVEEAEFKEKLKDAGRREADEHEVKEESEAGVSENVAKYGPDGQRRVDNAAAAHILDQEARGLTPEQAIAEERRILESGTPQDRILLDSVSRLRSALGDMKLSEASSELKQQILAQLKALNISASGKLVTNVPALQEALRQRFMAIPLERLDRNVLTYLLKEVASTLPPGATQEQVIGAVRKRWADLVVEATKHAEEKLAEDPLGAALEANRKRRSASKATSFRAVLAKTRRWSNKKNEPAVSFSYSPEWKVYAENAVRESGREWTPEGIRDWIKDLSEDDFAADIQAYFIPQFDPDVRLHFEREGGEGKGYDYTNLYGFAWNFKDSMPAEYADRLAEEYLNSPKMNRFYEERGAKGIKQREDVARKNSLAMWNHVDNFLGSGRFPKEQNVFRSAQSDLDNPTKWMNELFDEREKKEAAVINRMYKKDTPANKAARDTLSILFKLRRAAYAAGDESKKQEISEAIATEMVKGSKGGLVDWNLKSSGESETRHGVMIFESPRTVSPTERTQEEALKLKREGKRLKEQHKDLYDQVSALASAAQLREQLYGPNDPSFQSLNRQLQDFYTRIYTPAYQALVDWRLRSGVLEHEFLPIPVPYHGKLIESPLGHTAFMSYDAMQTIFKGDMKHQYSPLSVGGGLSIKASALPTLKADINQHASSYPYLSELNQFFDETIKATSSTPDKNVAFINAGQELSEVMDNYTEEWIHNIQAELGGGRISRHLDTLQYGILHNAIPPGMMRFLNEHYSFATSRVFVDEAAAKLLTKKAEAFGITKQEQKDFIFKYLSEIKNKHGVDAVKKFRTARGVGREVIGLIK